MSSLIKNGLIALQLSIVLVPNHLAYCVDAIGIWRTCYRDFKNNSEEICKDTPNGTEVTLKFPQVNCEVTKGFSGINVKNQTAFFERSVTCTFPGQEIGAGITVSCSHKEKASNMLILKKTANNSRYFVTLICDAAER